VYAELISPGCNVGVVATDKGTLLVDTPLLSRQAEAISGELTAAGHRPVRFIVLTHHHDDHILGTALFGDEAIIFGNRLVYQSMAEYDPASVTEWAVTWNWPRPSDPEEMASARIVRPDVVFEEKLTLYLGGTEVWLFPLPGHLEESTGVFVPESRVLITGDALFCNHHPYMVEGNLQEWLQCLDTMRELEAERIIPGHGPVCGYEAVDKLQRYIERVIEIRNRWDPADTEVPAAVVDEVLALYPLHGRPRDPMRERVLESIRVAGEPQY
jgi:glyoxylase-like metal-dependent hydrolase (beta-lactamase superfamily II)